MRYAFLGFGLGRFDGDGSKCGPSIDNRKCSNDPYECEYHRYNIKAAHGSGRRDGVEILIEFDGAPLRHHLVVHGPDRQHEPYGANR